jgi:hypothetical protein
LQLPGLFTVAKDENMTDVTNTGLSRPVRAQGAMVAGAAQQQVALQQRQKVLSTVLEVVSDVLGGQVREQLLFATALQEPGQREATAS